MGCTSSAHRDVDASKLAEGAFDDEFELDDEVLGEGAMGKVMLCVRRSTGHDFAAKLCSQNKDSLREVAIMQKLAHPGVLRLEGAFRTSPAPDGSGRLMLVLELANGGDLLNEVDRHGGKMSEGDAAYFMKQLLQAVAYLAEQPGGGIVHRDLKLTNVFLTGRKHHRDGTVGRPRVKLGDFGIAACARDLAAAATGKGGGAGTAQYASPEALAGAACTPASDVWSLGVIMFTLLCGEYPYSLPLDLAATDEVAILWGEGKHGILTDDARSAVRSMLTRAPESRPSAAELDTCQWITFQTWLTQNDYLAC